MCWVGMEEINLQSCRQHLKVLWNIWGRKGGEGRGAVPKFNHCLEAVNYWYLISTGG